MKINLKRIKKLEEPKNNLIYWLEDNKNDIIATHFNLIGNCHTRISTKKDCFTIGYPFTNNLTEKQVKESIIKKLSEE